MGTNTAIEKESYKAGDYIFFEGDLDQHFYIIESGEVQIFTKSTDGSRIDIIKINDGESFGEFALLDKKARSASAQAITDVELVKVSEAGYQQLLQELPVWASSMMKSFTTRLRNMNQLMKAQDQFLAKK